MSILNKLQEKQTGLQAYGLTPFLNMTERDTGEINYSTPDRNMEYVLEGTIRVKYWANKAQHPDARRQAEQLFLSHLYGDLYSQCIQIKSDLFNQDIASALKRLDKMFTEIGL